MNEREYNALISDLAKSVTMRTGGPGRAALTLIDAAAIAAADAQIDDAQVDDLIERLRESLATCRAVRAEAYARHAARTQPN